LNGTQKFFIYKYPSYGKSLPLPTGFAIINFDLYFLAMKQMIFILVSFLCIVQAGISQDTDSLVLENTQYLKKRINLLLYRLDQMKQTTNSELDSLQSLFFSSQEEIDGLRKQANQQQQSLQDSIENRIHQLRDSQNTIHKQIQRSSTWHWVLSGIAIALVIILLLLFLRERRRSVGYLIRKTEGIAGQNDQILEKAGELKELRADLEKNIKQQKKLRKKIKKKKK